MALKKERDELSHRTLEELHIALRASRQDLLTVRTNIAARKEEDNNRSRLLRRRIARILTYMEQKRRQAAADAGAPVKGEVR